MRPGFDHYGEHLRHSGGVKLGAPTELMRLSDVEAAAVRVAMTRLHKEGWFNSEKPGHEGSPHSINM